MYFDWGTKKNGDMKNENKNYTKKGMKSALVYYTH